ncbi:MAG TPA: hypothetical protein VNH46_01790, partial [Gemmatimonadales bacterium]|nr:hypothetical protein [Gemmatimonadales bacterium]
DAEDVLRDPRGMLQVLCVRVGVPFSERMLSWPAGPRPTDGIWARYWYDAVERSTGFEPWRPRPRTVAPELAPLLEQCQPLYQELARHRLGPA